MVYKYDVLACRFTLKYKYIRIEKREHLGR